MKTAVLLVTLLAGLATVPAKALAPAPLPGEGGGAPHLAALTPQEIQELVDQLVWTAGSLQRVLAEQDYPALLMLSALNRVLPQEGEGTLAGLGPLLAELALGPGNAPGSTAALQRCRAQVSPVEGALCSLETLIPLAPPSLGRELAEEGARLVALYTRPGKGTLGGTLASAFGLDPLQTGTLGGTLASVVAGGGGSRLDPLQRFAEEALEGAWRLRAAALAGQEDLPDAQDTLDPARPSFTPLDGILSALTGFTPTDGAEALLSRVPQLQSLLALHPVLSLSGEAAQAPQRVLGEYQAFLGSLTGSVQEALSMGREEVSELGGLALSLEGQARDAVDWASRRSFVYLASRSAALAGFDQDIAERIRVVGNAASDLHRSASAFPSNLMALGQQAAAAALGGNVFAVAANLTSFFGLTPGALGPGAAAEVRALRDALDSMRTELGDRLDEVDARFDDLFQVLDTRFGHLEALVASSHGEVQASLQALHQDVLALGIRMDRMETNLYSYMQAGFDRDYNRTLVRCLEHRDRHLPPFDQMEFPVFSECLADFRTRAVQDARDALLTDQATPVDDVSLTEALADTSMSNLARRLPLLSRVARERFGHSSMAVGRGLANPLEWAVASQAYLTMIQDWPEHARAVAPGDLEVMRSTGLDVRNALQSVAVDPLSRRPGSLLRDVFAYYQGQVASLTAEADVLARRHQQAHLRRIPADAILNRMEPWQEGMPTLAVPQPLALTVPQEVRTAAVLALGEASLVYRLSAQDSVSRENFRRRLWIFGRRHDRLTFTRTQLEVELRFGREGTLATHRLTGPFLLRIKEEMAGGEDSEKVRAIRIELADPWSHFLVELLPELADDPAAWEVSSPVPNTLQALEEAIEEELRRHASAALDNVFTTVCQRDPASSEMSDQDRASALRIRSAMEGLTAARTLLQAYLRLALPGSAGEGTRLREALWGREAVLDREGLCLAFAAGENPLRIVWLEEEPRQRAASLAEALEAALSWEGDGVPYLSILDETMDQIEATIRVQRIRMRVARGGG
jgi:hypothetical protein